MILLEVRTMENIKLILCDLDGTLLNNESMVTDYTKAAIQKAKGNTKGRFRFVRVRNL